MAGFNKEQLTQLEELFDRRLEAQDIRLITELDRRFGGQQAWIESRFEAQDRRIDEKFASERTYIRQLIREELGDIRSQLERLSTRMDPPRLKPWSPRHAAPARPVL